VRRGDLVYCEWLDQLMVVLGGACDPTKAWTEWQGDVSYFFPDGWRMAVFSKDQLTFVARNQMGALR
jgi:hypothetical protein